MDAAPARAAAEDEPAAPSGPAVAAHIGPDSEGAAVRAELEEARRACAGLEAERDKQRKRADKLQAKGKLAAQVAREAQGAREAAEARLGLGRIVVLHCCPSISHQIR